MNITIRLQPLPQSVNVKELEAIRGLLDVKLSDDLPPSVLDLIYTARISVDQAMFVLSGLLEVVN